MAQDMIFDGVELAQPHEYNWPAVPYHANIRMEEHPTNEEVLYLQPLIPPKRFDIFFPITGGCSEAINSQTSGLSVLIFLDHVFSVP